MPRTERPPGQGAAEPVHPDVRYEREDVRTSVIVRFGFWMFVAAIVIYVGLWGLLKFFSAEVSKEQPAIPPSVAASLRRTPASPRLEAVPLLSRQRTRAEEDARLSSYGWIDRSGGVARIPIDRAIEMIAERGVPGGKPMTPGAAAAGSAVPPEAVAPVATPQETRGR